MRIQNQSARSSINFSRRAARTVTALASAAALVLAGVPANASVWIPALEPGDSEFVSFTLLDGVMLDSHSQINILPSKNSPVTGQQKQCEEFGEPGCKLDKSLTAWTNRILPLCENATAINCIEDFAVGTREAEPQSASPMPELGGFKLKAVPSLGIPKGSLPTIFESSIPNASGSGKYALIASMMFDIADGKAQPGFFRIAVTPVSDRVDEGRAEVRFGKGFHGEMRVLGNADLHCAAVDRNYCAQVEKFAPETNVRVTVRLSNKVSGWLKGRLTDPNISSEAIAGGANRYVIQGEAVEVPRIQAKAPKTHRIIRAGEGMTGVSTQDQTYSFFNADSKVGLDVVSTFAKQAKDTAAVMQSSWYVSTIQDTQALYNCRQFDNQFIGLVTTNSMAFDGGIPEFKNGFFSYNVAGLHYAPDGKTEIMGTYDLAIRTDVARCLYGFSKAPISATLSVTGSSGEEKVATSIVNERGGWLTLSAKDFTFSKNQIKVRVTQPKKFTVAKFSGSSKVLSAAQKRSITAATPRKGTEVTCVGLYRENKNQKLAAERAKASCAQVATKLRGIKRTIETKKVSSASLEGRVQVTVQ